LLEFDGDEAACGMGAGMHVCVCACVSVCGWLNVQFVSAEVFIDACVVCL